VEEGVEQETAVVDDVAEDGVVRAAGGLVVRRPAWDGERGDSEGEPQVILVHRPKYDDWSFPKGKAEPGETDEETALREVEEETGLRCRLGVELPTVEYRDRYDRPKRVRYWLMEAEDGSATARADNEVDEVRWLGRDEAAATLSYERDRRLLTFMPR
jgi:8-oxo-dGTP diphosphatase